MKEADMPEEWVISSSVLVCSKSGKIIASCLPTGSGVLDPSLDEAEANAESIVQTHNSYQKLLEASKKALEFIEAYRERVMKSEIMGKLLEGDYEIKKALEEALK